MASANSAKKAQEGANATNAQIAADTNAANWRAYQYSRGLDEDGNPVNTRLPIWSTSGGQPTEQYLLNQLLNRSGIASQAQADDPGYYASVNQTRKFLAANPETLADIKSWLGRSSDTRSPEQWLHDHVTQTEKDQGGGGFTDLLKAYAQTTVPAAEKPTVPAEYQALQNAAIYTANQIYGTAGNDWNNYLTDNPDVASAYNGLYKDEQGRSLVPTGSGQVVAMTPQEFAQYHYNTWGSTEGRATRQDSLLNQELDALAPVLDARTALAAQEQARNTELRARYGDIFSAETQGLADLLTARQAGSTDIFSAEKQGLADLLAARRTASTGIYDAEKLGLADLLAAREAAANDIYGAETAGLDRLLNTRRSSIDALYGAEMGQADTYEQAAQQALQRVLNEQTANRARQGFVGASSGDALLKARTLADGLQQSAGARAQVGVNQASRLGQATEQDALSRLTSDVGQQTRLGSSREQNALGLLTAGVGNQTRLGSAAEQNALGLLTAGVGNQTRLASAGEQNALGRLSAGVTNANRLASVLDADARKAESQAALENALARLTTVSNDINRRTASTGLAGQLYGQQTALQNTATNQSYADLDALLSRLGQFNSATQSTPQAQSYTVQPTIGSGQIAGAAISNLGQMAGNYFTTQSLINSLNRPSTTSVVGASTPVTMNYTGVGNYGSIA